MTKKFAIQHNLTIIWVSAESDHDKAPMDGVGASIKNEIDNATLLRLIIGVSNKMHQGRKFQDFLKREVVFRSFYYNN